MFKATFVIALLLVTIPLGEALAVSTKNCPKILDVTAGKVEIARSRIDRDDKDIDTIQAALEVLEARGPFSDQLTLVEKANGICHYKGPTALTIVDNNSFGTMLYFFGLPGPYYDGGFELRPIGRTEKM